MNTKELIKAIKCGGFDEMFRELYGSARLADTRVKYVTAIENFERYYGEGREGAMLFSVPGRTEICGNHTDHNGGKVVASSIYCDMIGVAAPAADKRIRVRTEGFREDIVELPVGAPDRYPRYKSSALIAGMCAAAEKNGYSYGAFDAYTVSAVPKGSGLSSSAAFEVLIGTMIDHLFNSGRIGAVECAKMSQYSENVYFGKPCGLMDQMACAVGGIITIDFGDPADPKVEKIGFDLGENGYSLVIIATGGSHSDLNEEYASIPAEMKKVASAFGQEKLRGISKEEILSRYASLRPVCGDRAILRALHFACENERVDNIVAAMKRDDVDGFLSVIKASGDSSWRFLQNVTQARDPSEQGVATALMLCESFFDKYNCRGVCRVHGGGFAGTAQAFIPSEYEREFCAFIDSVMGSNSAMVMPIRHLGAVGLG